MRQAWLRSTARSGATLAAGVAADLALGLGGWGVAAIVGAGLAAQTWSLYRFSRWFAAAPVSMPDHLSRGGVWERLHRLALGAVRRSERRHRRLGDYLRRSRQLASALPDAIIALTSDNGIEWFNKAAGEVFGLRQRDLGQRVDNLLRYPGFIAHLHGGNHGQEIRLALPERPGQVFALCLVPYGEGQRLLIARDISDAAKLEAMHRDFVASASHELRTPLTVLAGYLEVLADRFDDDPAIARVLGQMQAQEGRMRQLIEDLLMISRLEAPAVEIQEGRVAMGPLLERLEREAVSLSQGRHRIGLEIEGSVDLFGEEKTLYSAFSNLVGNALQYTPDGGRIDIAWRGGQGGARFEVRDTGCGIPPQHIPRLTERFYRVDSGRSSELGGTGLGLSIVKHVLRLHDARLEIESQVGQGSRFACLFPAGRCLVPPSG